MSRIGYDTVLADLHKLVRDNPDRSNGECIYSRPEEEQLGDEEQYGPMVPVCIVGQVLDIHDLLGLVEPDAEQLVEMDWEPEGDLGGYFTWDALRLLSEVQQMADAGNPTWAAALDDALDDALRNEAAKA